MLEMANQHSVASAALDVRETSPRSFPLFAPTSREVIDFSSRTQRFVKLWCK